MQGSHVGIIGQLSTLFADFDAGGASNAISVPFADEFDNRQLATVTQANPGETNNAGIATRSGAKLRPQLCKQQIDG